MLLLLLLGIVISSFSVIIFKLSGERYLLPFFSGILFLLLFLFLTILPKAPKLSTFIAATAALINLSCSVHFGKSYVSYWLEPELNDMKALNGFVTELEKRKMSNLLSVDWFFCWQINYLGNEKISCRYLESNDRVSRFAQKVDSCYTSSNCTVALAGGTWPLYDMQTIPGWNEKIEIIEKRYFIYEYPAPIYLKKGGFNLPPIPK